MEDSNLLYEMGMAYRSLCWFISMSLGNRLHPIMPFAIIIPIGLGLVPFLVKNDWFRNLKKDVEIKYSISFMPIFWVAIGIWGGIFKRQKPPLPQWPAYIEYVILALLVGFCVYGIYRIIKNRGYRILTIILFLVNAYFAVMVTFCAGMSITGVWL